MSDSSTSNDEKKNHKKIYKKTRDAVLQIGVGAILIFLVVLLYKSWLQLDGKQKNNNQIEQEQFVGEAQISDALQAECQKSAEKIITFAKSNNASGMFTEYKLNAENCRQAYFYIENKFNFNPEGVYPSLAVDIAIFTAKSNTQQAIEVLKFAKTIDQWIFDTGPISCDSNVVIEAYLESLNQSDGKVCLTKSDKEQLVSELQNKNFTILSKGLKYGRVVYLGVLNSDIGCPEKISAVIKFIQSSVGNDFDIIEDQLSNELQNTISFTFKSKESTPEDKLTIVFDQKEDCLQLKYVLLPDQQLDE